MRRSCRPALAAKATSLVCTGLLALTSAVPAAGAAASDARREAGCRGATVTRDYTAESMTYRLRLDLDGCGWWDGSARNLVIWLSRDDGAGAASRYSMAACEADRNPGAAATTTCEVFVTLGHAAERAVPPPPEAKPAATTGATDPHGRKARGFVPRCVVSEGTGSGRTDPVSGRILVNASGVGGMAQRQGRVVDVRAIWRFLLRGTRRAAVTVAGFTLAAVGVAGLLLPILPGWALIIAGLIVLSREYSWAYNALSFARRHATRGGASLRSMAGRARERRAATYPSGEVVIDLTHPCGSHPLDEADEEISATG
jgi:hypothetical protein